MYLIYNRDQIHKTFNEFEKEIKIEIKVLVITVFTGRGERESALPKKKKGERAR